MTRLSSGRLPRRTLGPMEQPLTLTNTHPTTPHMNCVRTLRCIVSLLLAPLSPLSMYVAFRRAHDTAEDGSSPPVRRPRFQPRHTRWVHASCGHGFGLAGQACRAWSAASSAWTTWVYA